MSETPEGIYYAESHEWARLEEDGRITVGITDYAQGALGDIVYIELPQIGQSIQGSVPIFMLLLVVLSSLSIGPWKIRRRRSI